MRPALLASALVLVLQTAVGAQHRPPSLTEIDRRFRELAQVQRTRATSDSIRLRQLSELYFEWQLTESPESATFIGHPGHDHLWTDLSATAIARRKREAGRTLAVLNTIDRQRLSTADRLTYDLLVHEGQMAVEQARFPGELLQVTALSGIQRDIPDVVSLMRIERANDVDAIFARLQAFPRLVRQVIALLDTGLARGITPPRITLHGVADAVGRQIVDDPAMSAMIAPLAKLPPTIPEDERLRLRERGTALVRDSVLPAWRQLHRFLVDRYVPGARESIGLSALPNGEAWYAVAVRQYTTTDMSPSAIHELGLREVARIRGAMDSVMVQTGFKGTFAEFIQFLRTDPRFYFTDTASLLREYRDIAKRIDPGLIRLFGRLPRMPYGVIAVPAYSERNVTTAYYMPGSPEAARPGYFYANTYDLKSRPKWEMEALTVHEAVPGHHLQIAIAQELENVPEFRKHLGFTAFVEGWGLYSESLGHDLGLYRDPYSRFGALTYDMWRAVRLVLDTGLHSMGWSRQQAIDYFAANSSKPLHDITVEVDRYISWPGQALAYKIGQLKIRELREFATTELGDAFDVRAFHDEVLGAGAVPLGVLDARIREWVARQKQRV
ncbi:MAG TPA: DUF885 domain-containing protein [Gemmatimonadaceae bacterium]|nr:DUF885 domain-containing protein [Gemmatimonadaceae bacterium]